MPHGQADRRNCDPRGKAGCGSDFRRKPASGTSCRSTHPNERRPIPTLCSPARRAMEWDGARVDDGRRHAPRTSTARAFTSCCSGSICGLFAARGACWTFADVAGMSIWATPTCPGTSATALMIAASAPTFLARRRARPQGALHNKSINSTPVCATRDSTRNTYGGCGHPVDNSKPMEMPGRPMEGYIFVDPSRATSEHRGTGSSSLLPS
jgi:hypothetical protein